MSNVIPIRPKASPVVVDEDYMAPLSNDQLAYKIWKSLDEAEAFFLSEDQSCDVERNDAEFALIEAGIAATVLARRLLGRDPQELYDELWQRMLASLADKQEDDQ